MIVPELPRKGHSVLYTRICDLLIKFAKQMVLMSVSLISFRLNSFSHVP